MFNKKTIFLLFLAIISLGAATSPLMVISIILLLFYLYVLMMSYSSDTGRIFFSTAAIGLLVYAMTIGAKPQKAMLALFLGLGSLLTIGIAFQLSSEKKFSGMLLATYNGFSFYIRDFSSLVDKLRNAADNSHYFIQKQLPVEIQKEIASFNEGKSDMEKFSVKLRACLKELISKKNLYDEASLTNVRLTGEIKKILSNREANIPLVEPYLNCLLLAQIFPREIVKLKEGKEDDPRCVDCCCDPYCCDTHCCYCRNSEGGCCMNCDPCEKGKEGFNVCELCTDCRGCDGCDGCSGCDCSC